MFLKILIAFLIAVSLVAVVISLQPAQYRVVRTASFEAPPSATYNLISDFHNWSEWSPWAKLDPDMKQAFEGPRAGVGASYTWSGNKVAGEGSMTIVEAIPDERLAIQLAFTKPFASASKITFSLRPEGSGTSVEWAMDGESTFATKAIQVFASMDKMVGLDFEKGLAKLRPLAEEAARKQAKPALSH